ncbi:MAG: hypothetical protein J7M39_05805 [Anaerolineae bacterium]|nr:hypothetical protein [Anaerolineae bacterium]
MITDVSPLTIRATKPNSAPSLSLAVLSALMLEYGISIVSTRDSDQTAHLPALLARHAQLGVPEISLVPKRKAVDLPDLQRRVVEMLPGCGRVTARDLLQHFGILATFAVSDYVARDPDIDAVAVDAYAVIGVLKELRQRRDVTDTAV